MATMQTGRLIRPAKNPHNYEENVSASPHARWLEGLLWSWTSLFADGELAVGGLPARVVPHARDAFDRVIVQLRPPVEVDAEGRWSPATDPPLLEGLQLALDRAGDHVDTDKLWIATDLAPAQEGNQAASEHLSAIQEMAADAGAQWWATSPIDGWHWENGSRISPGIVGRDRRVRADPSPPESSPASGS